MVFGNEVVVVVLVWDAKNKRGRKKKNVCCFFLSVCKLMKEWDPERRLCSDEWRDREWEEWWCCCLMMMMMIWWDWFALLPFSFLLTKFTTSSRIVVLIGWFSISPWERMRTTSLIFIILWMWFVIFFFSTLFWFLFRECVYVRVGCESKVELQRREKEELRMKKRGGCGETSSFCFALTDKQQS